MHKDHKLSSNWLNETFKIVKFNEKNAVIEDSERSHYLRNKVHLRKSIDNDKTQQFPGNIEHEYLTITFNHTPFVVTKT